MQKKSCFFVKKAEGGKIERGKSWELLQTTILTIILFSRSLDSCHRSYVRRSLSKIINLLHARINIPRAARMKETGYARGDTVERGEGERGKAERGEAEKARGDCRRSRNGGGRGKGISDF